MGERALIALETPSFERRCWWSVRTRKPVGLT